MAKQKVITSLFTKIIEIRKTLQNENLNTPAVLETSMIYDIVLITCLLGTK